ncbi:hypothetical protein QUG98_09755 [Curtobacterium sp. RHCJP20]|uniref:Restriction endonuclease n=1 Tax=Curtobacterium subtropicum TaxID=3055138 RepID=A0ABT7TGP0_9MICO|nr:hypothetical protein [Curtobacterium subtropicum]MDM7888738.1 hypothetical protein [Curtobacterium subtropicum]
MPDAPHPRILFEAVPDDLYRELEVLAGTAFRITASTLPWEIHDSDWDLLVSFADVPYRGRAIHSLTFGALGFRAFRQNGVERRTDREVPSFARETRVPEGIEGEQRRLLERSVVANDPGPGIRKGLRNLPPRFTKLVTAGEEHVAWAALFHYSTDLMWALPAETTHHVEWLALVLRLLHDVEPGRFPSEPDWRSRDDWATPEVLSTRAEVRALRIEKERVIADFDQRDAGYLAKLEVQQADAASGALRLLTGQGEDLVAAVAIALESFGFDVADMDDHHDEKTGAKLEDLRVSFATDVGVMWTALVEVKGYGKGAKVNDVGQVVARPALVFFKETGQEPEGLWHIANSFREQDPSTRPKALAGSADLTVLAASGGCFIDTRDLFRAWRDVTQGIATAAVVRASLVAAKERWEWPGASA